MNQLQDQVDLGTGGVRASGPAVARVVLGGFDMMTLDEVVAKFGKAIVARCATFCGPCAPRSSLKRVNSFGHLHVTVNNVGVTRNATMRTVTGGTARWGTHCSPQGLLEQHLARKRAYAGSEVRLDDQAALPVREGRDRRAKEPFRGERQRRSVLGGSGGGVRALRGPGQCRAARSHLHAMIGAISQKAWDAQMTAKAALDRYGEMEDVVRAGLFLASGVPSYATGHHLVASGGRLT